jgi:hypothetical protein
VTPLRRLVLRVAIVDRLAAYAANPDETLAGKLADEIIDMAVRAHGNNAPLDILDHEPQEKA